MQGLMVVASKLWRHDPAFQIKFVNLKKFGVRGGFFFARKEMR